MRLTANSDSKTVTDFFAEIADEHLDVARVVEQYEAMLRPEESPAESRPPANT